MKLSEFERELDQMKLVEVDLPVSRQILRSFLLHHKNYLTAVARDSHESLPVVPFRISSFNYYLPVFQNAGYASSLLNNFNSTSICP